MLNLSNLYSYYGGSWVKPYIEELLAEEKKLESSLSELNTELNEFERNKKRELKKIT